MLEKNRHVLRVLHCPTTVGGNAQGLARAERALGVQSKSLALSQNFLQYQSDEVVFRGNWFFDEFRRWGAVIKALSRYDVLHFNSGTSLLPVRVDPAYSSSGYPPWFRHAYNLVYAGWAELLDVAWAHRLGKVIAVTYQGDDARQGDFCRQHYPIHFVREVGEGYYSDFSDQLKRERITVFDRYADLIYAVNPDLLNVLPKRARFIPYAHVNLESWQPVWSKEAIPAIPHVVHAPTHRLVKGSRFIIDALNRLKAEGVPFRYTLVEKRSNEEARKIYETADLLVDQLLAGFYGGLAVELMALGKPVISYLREEDMRYLPQGMWADMPIINATPDSIYDVLKSWLTSRKNELRQKGIASREYVERWHDPKKIAAQLICDYQIAYERKTGSQHNFAAKE